MFLVFQILNQNTIDLEAKTCFLGIHDSAVTTSFPGIFSLGALEPVENVLVPERHRTECL